MYGAQVKLRAIRSDIVYLPKCEKAVVHKTEIEREMY
jgi:hypothetical protein